MSHVQRKKLAPFVSLVILVAIGLSTVFIKMEVVREGYEVLHLGQSLKLAMGHKAEYDMVYAKLIRPERLDFIGTQRLSLARAQKNQVVLMAARGGITFRQ